ncbi:MAG: hypothetical protein GQ527_02225 [Bacteroidales bacterium]|nr:hypothetical protein [Bacteroidales bacterium]
MKKFTIALMLMTIAFFAVDNDADAQIWEPEGINMPGAWNGWTNPPTNNLALASSTQVPGGLIIKRSNGTTANWNTILHVAAAGGDVVGGNYDWIFTSGSSGNPWGNKWAGVNVTIDMIQNYSFNNGADNNVTLVNDKWYDVNWEDIGYSDTRAIFMELSAEPIQILTVSVPTNVMPNTVVPITVTTDNNLSPEEIVYIGYTIDNWTTSTAVAVTMTGTSGTASIPGQATNTIVEYYAFNSTIAGLTVDFDIQAINMNSNGGSNYSYTIGTPPPPTIDWVNLQWPPNGNIDVGQPFDVYGQIYMNGVTDGAGQGADIQAWVGYSTDDTDPATWTNWVPASYLGDVGNNDEYTLDLGNAIGQAGTFYYATRYQYLAQGYVYGGFNGGFWDGTNNVSGTLTINSVIPVSNWAIGLFGLFFLTFVFIRIRR